jgi:hypothetical protein
MSDRVNGPHDITERLVGVQLQRSPAFFDPAGPVVIQPKLRKRHGDMAFGLGIVEPDGFGGGIADLAGDFAGGQNCPLAQLEVRHGKHRPSGSEARVALDGFFEALNRPGGQELSPR